MESLQALDPAGREAHLEGLKRPDLQKLAKEAGLKVTILLELAGDMPPSVRCGE